MKKKLPLIYLLLSLPLLFTSCATILNGKEQKVQINTNSADSKVYLNDELVGEGETIIAEMPRDQKVQQIKVERNGYKDQYLTHYQTRKSPYYIMSWVPFGVLFFPPLNDIGPKTFDYKKEVSVNPQNKKVASRAENEKFIYIKKAAFNVDPENYTVDKIKRRHYRKGKDKFEQVDINDGRIDFDNRVFTNSINETLLKYNYVDTTNTILKKKNNTLYINASVKEINFSNIYQKSARTYQLALQSKVIIDWEITDFYGQSKFSKTVKGQSGEFSVSEKEEERVTLCLEDAIVTSFIQFSNDAEVRKLLAKNNEKEIIFEYLTLKKQTAPSDLEQAMEATVTIETDLGHGSGFAVSADGYIITNLHVIANAKEIKVLTKDGETIPAELIRQNENIDLALLKVNSAFNYAFSLSNTKNFSVGEDIYAIGTPNSIELGQTLSKGIISGERSNEEDNYIQTDASVNSGNSGGPLINEKGQLLGIVNAKLRGNGVEGIGFAIPVFEVQKTLFVK